MKNPLEVIEKGMISITPIDNTVVLQKVKHLIRKLKPERIIIEDFRGTYSNKSQRVIEVLRAIQKYSKQKGFALSSYSREQIRLVFSNWQAETRYEIAEVISRNVEAFTNLMFDKPKYPKTEHFRSAQFDAASLGITHYYNAM
ncbi:hypothetical protein H9W90_11950 [Polaribacter pectinis]|uniref:Uncharacterized protein n=1 Tax=Polaribacter pectinis TaxID=2738844 RepID=A0A7G9L8F0_9FLAO|nr:hypothetical protein [Polaribacter pectinis]QNM84899.1 hypothetical protein H9W90_11950 [Polaribacter pectinis]